MFHAFVKRRGPRSAYTSVMFGKYTVAELGALVADPSRVAMLTLLLDGERHSAGDLAKAAGLSPQAASAHLTKLTDGGLVRATRAGRQRMFELDRPEVGRMLESLGAATRSHFADTDSRRANEPMRFARTCYDHLAGEVAVLSVRAWIEQGILRSHSRKLSRQGEEWFSTQGIDADELRRERRFLAHACLDWTEREPHLGGSLGAAWLQRCFAEGWFKRIAGTRAVRVSESGRTAFRELLGFDTNLLRRPA
jgi:DNA-binding transcriptional ArsR family regulator